MAELSPFREPLRVTLTRTIGIAIVAGAIVAASSGHIRRWPILSLLMLWPSVGGHWVDVWFLNGLRPHLPQSALARRVARIAVWFIAGIVLGIGVRFTAIVLAGRPSLEWLTWAIAGSAFVGVELVAHTALHLRGRPSFYDGRG